MNKKLEILSKFETGDTPTGADFAELIEFCFNEDSFSLGLVSDGVKNETEKLQSEINSLHNNGGGILKLPSGMFKVNGLILKENVILLGDNKKTTTIIIDNTPGIIMESNSTIENVTIKGNSESYIGDWTGGIHLTNGSKQLINNCDFKNLYTCIYNQSSSNFVIKKCDFSCDAPDGYGLYSEISKNAVIEGNNFECTEEGTRPICFQFFAHNCTIKENTIIGNNMAITGILFMNHYDNYNASIFSNRVIGNYVKDVYEEGISFDMMMESEKAEERWTGGTVTSSSSNIYSNSLVDSEAEWWSGSLYLRYILITSGKGVGQIRQITSNNETALTIDKTWDVLPDSTSTYIIGSFGFDNVIHDNVVENCGRQGLLLYGTNLRSQITNNIVKNCGINTDTTVYEWSGIGIVSCEANEIRRYRPSLYNLVSNNVISGGKTGIVVCSAPWSGSYTPVMLPSNSIIKGNTIQEMNNGIWIREGEKSIVSENSLSNVNSSIRLDTNTKKVKVTNNILDVAVIDNGTDNNTIE